MNYIVPDTNIAELESRIAKLNKRARKLDVPEITVAKVFDHARLRIRSMNVGCETTYKWMTAADFAAVTGDWPHEDTGERLTYWSVDVVGVAPALADWTFVAVLEPLPLDDGGVENFTRTLPGEHCPAEFRTRVSECDHCNIKIRRNETFVVRHADGTHKCVGRQCLKDFLGYHADPQKLASWAEMLAQLGTLCESAGDGEWMGGGSSRPDAWDLERFLALTAARVRLFGWLSKGQAWNEDRTHEATASVVLSLLTPPHPSRGQEALREWQDQVAAHPIETVDATRAAAAVEWAKDLTPGDNDYLANVNLVARVGLASRKTAGVAASIIVAYAKAVEEEVRRQERARRPESQWLGTIGERIKLVMVTVERVIAKEAHYGITHIHQMHDAAGNDLTWFGTSGALTEGATYAVSVTIKKHGDFHGRKQTVVTRLAVWTDEGLAAHRAKEERKAVRAAKKAAKLLASAQALALVA